MKVTVDFPEGQKEVDGFLDVNAVGSVGAVGSINFSTPTPSPMEGWMFIQTIGNGWIAVRSCPDNSKVGTHDRR